MSHLLIWRDIVSQCVSGAAAPDASFLVIEDDWQIVYLGGQDLLKRQHQYQVAPGVRRLYKGFRETTAYMINQAGAKACLEVCVPMHWQVDTHLNDESLREGLVPPKPDEKDYTMHPRGYCLHPPIVVQQRD